MAAPSLRTHAQERTSGERVRMLVRLLFERCPGLSRRRLARILRDRLSAEHGFHCHERTLRRQLTGFIRTAPAQMEAGLRSLLRETGLSPAAVDRALRQAGVPDPADGSGMGDAARLVALANLWLYLNPRKSRRGLAQRLRVSLRRDGLNLSLDSLQSMLAGRQLGIRREVMAATVALLRPHGLRSEEEALAQAEACGGSIKRFFRARELVSASAICALADLWRITNREVSSRRLAGLIQKGLSDRGPDLSLHQIQALLDGRVRQGRRAIADVLTQLLRENGNRPSPEDVRRVRSGQAREDLAWVDARLVRDKAAEWLARHPEASGRQLALRIAGAARGRGYSASHNSIQPLIGGWKKKCRGFVLRALIETLRDDPHGTPDDNHGRCRMRGCVFPACYEGWCSHHWAARHDPIPFMRFDDQVADL